jgi:hypothetical protein
MFYQELFKAFNDAQVIYLVTGGLAVNLHGVPRNSFDIDIITKMNDKNLFKLMKVLKDLGFIPKQPVNPMDFAVKKIRDEWIHKKNMKAFNFYSYESGFKEVDIVIDHPIDFDLAYERRNNMEMGNIFLPVISIDDLITMKINSSRDKDLLDIKELEILQEAKKKSWPSHRDINLKDWSVYNNEEYKLYEYSLLPAETKLKNLNDFYEFEKLVGLSKR